MVRKTLYFILPAELRNLSVVDEPLTQIFDEWEDLEVDESVIYDIKLAIQELCTNIVNHSYGGEKGKIRLRVILEDDPPSVCITSEDEGMSVFDEETWEPPALGEPQVHGFGMFLIRELMDEVSYRPSPGNNRWSLIKRLPVPSVDHA